jgi:hypothetical protein
MTAPTDSLSSARPEAYRRAAGGSGVIWPENCLGCDGTAQSPASPIRCN